MTAPMTPARLKALAEQIYGPQWQTPLARDLKVSTRTVRRWAAGGTMTGLAEVAVEGMVKIARVKQDCDFLIACIDMVSEATGEGPESDDAVIFEQIKAERRRAAQQAREKRG